VVAANSLPDCTPNPLLAAALAYADRGWPVVPLHFPLSKGTCSCGNRNCGSVGKHPRTPHGLKDATTDLAQVQAWWERWPKANVGVLTGHASDLVVLDVDPRHGGSESLAELEVRRLLPPTARTVTGSGGQHIFFAHPGGRVGNSTGKLGAGLDVKADGGYIVAPPSLHASGRHYQWAAHPDHTPLSGLPGGLLELLTGVRTGERASNPGTGAPIPRGQRNVTLTRLAGALRRHGMTEAAIAAALQVVNSERCAPLLPETEVRRIASSVARYVCAPIAGGSDDGPAPPYTLHWADEALEPQPPVDWVIARLFARGGVYLVVGDPKSKKTYALLDAGVCTAHGLPWVGHATTQGTVLFVDEESGERRLNRRLAAVMRGHEVGKGTPLAYTTLENWSLLRDQHVAKLSELIDEIGASAVIIDALADVTPDADENAKKDMQPFFQKLRRLADQKRVAVIVIHHSNREGHYRGSSAMPGAVDGLIEVASKPDDSTITFSVKLPRDTEPFTFTATANFEDVAPDSTPGRVYLTEARCARLAPGKKLSGSEQYVRRYLLAHSGATVKDVENGADSCSAGTARTKLYDLARRGLVRRTNPGEAGEARFEWVGDGRPHMTIAEPLQDAV
jgi:hypothetical protein